jgi:hypothetical protein
MENRFLGSETIISTFPSESPAFKIIPPILDFQISFPSPSSAFFITSTAASPNTGFCFWAVSRVH